MSLTLGRKASQFIVIDPARLNIRVNAYAVDAYGRTLPGVKIRVSIEADPSIKIVREELLETDKDRKEPT